MTSTLQGILRMFDGLSANTWYGKLGISIGTAVTAFYSPISALLLCCFAFTIADMLYGMKVSRRFKRKITSKRNWKGTLTKILDEFSIISLARLLEWSVMDEQGVFVLTGGVTIVIALTELWSILENLHTLNPDGPWKALGKFLKKKGEDYIGTDIELNDDDTNNNKVDSSES